MEVEHHILLLHRAEDGVVDAVVLDAGRRVGGDPAGVRLDTWGQWMSVRAFAVR